MEGRSRCDWSVSQGILRRWNRHFSSMRIIPAWPMIVPARAPLQTLLEGIGSRFPRLLLSSRLLARSGRSLGGDVSAGPPTGYITHLIGTYPKKRFPKSPLPGNDSCMRGELNAAQSPLTMGNCAQPEMTGSRFDCPGSESLGAPQISNKKPLPAAGAHNRFVVADGLRGRGIWREFHPGCCCPSSGR